MKGFIRGKGIKIEGEIKVSFLTPTNIKKGELIIVHIPMNYDMEESDNDDNNGTGR